VRLPAGVDEPDLTDDPQAPRAQGSRFRLLLAACACATGGALLVHITSKVSLAFAAVSLLVVAVVVFIVVTQWLDPVRRRYVARRVRVGAISGLIATMAYDLARFGTVALFQMSFKPFHVFELFGQGLLDAEVTGPGVWIAGAAFHIANGTGFGVAFAMAVRRPTILKGIAWAMFLELTMVAFYPSWLQLQALGEFLQVSVVGHFVYGVTLATLVRRQLRDE
jgi:hypothetical protein